MDLANDLRLGLEQMDLDLAAPQQQQLLDYLRLFEKWNKAYNLSAIRQIEAMLGRHLLDSLSVLTHLKGADSKRFIDVGTGGGLPGIPLAISLPHWHWTLLDSNGKKTRFLTEVKARLGLANVTVINTRVEAFQPEAPFDGVISRAFASLKDMIDGCQHLLAEDGAFWAMKGLYPEQELAELGPVLSQDYRVLASWPLQVPGETGERHLLKMGR